MILVGVDFRSKPDDIKIPFVDDVLRRAVHVPEGGKKTKVGQEERWHRIAVLSTLNEKALQYVVNLFLSRRQIQLRIRSEDESCKLSFPHLRNSFCTGDITAVIDSCESANKSSRNTKGKGFTS